MNPRVELSQTDRIEYLKRLLILTVPLAFMIPFLCYRIYRIVSIQIKFPETSARVLSEGNTSKAYVVEINLRGKILREEIEVDAQFYAGQIISVRYNPSNPSEIYYDYFGLLEGFLFLGTVLIGWFILMGWNDPKWLIQHSGNGM